MPKSIFQWIEEMGDDAGFPPPPPPPAGTPAHPGSDEKIRVFEERMRDGYDLWHHDDQQQDWVKFRRLLAHLYRARNSMRGRK